MRSFIRPLPVVALGLAWGAFSPAPAQSAPARIEIVVVEGEGVAYSPGQRAPRNLVVRVEDDDHRPVAGASVNFALPVSGASGEFANGSSNLSVVTDNQGLGTAHGFRPNQVPGKVQIYVTASYHGSRAKTLITQTIEGGAPAAKTARMERRKSGGKWKWIVISAAAAAAAGGGVYYGVERHSSSTPVSVGAGTVVFGSTR